MHEADPVGAERRAPELPGRRVNVIVVVPMMLVEVAMLQFAMAMGVCVEATAPPAKQQAQRQRNDQDADGDANGVFGDQGSQDDEKELPTDRQADELLAVGN